MNIQEQEELDYLMGAADELQNAYALSKMETQVIDPKIAEEKDKDKWVLYISATAYCPRTDAILGAQEIYVASYDTPQEAKEALLKSCGDEELQYRVAFSDSKSKEEIRALYDVDMADIDMNSEEEIPF